MGSWNETCALSHLPIRGGDEVVFLILTKSPYDESEPQAGSGGPSSYWFVRTLPVVAKYNDYGSIEEWAETEQPLIDGIVAGYQDDIAEVVASRRDELSGIPSRTSATVTWPNLLKWLRNDGVQVRSDCRRIMEREPPRALPCVAVMVRHDVWNEMLTLELKGWNWNEIYTYDRVTTNAAAWLQGLRKRYLQEMATSETGVPGTSLARIACDLWNDDRDNVYNHIYLPSGIGTRTPHFEQGPAEAVKEAVGNAVCYMVEGNADLVLSRFGQLHFVESAMAQLRLGWHPTAGVGSQSFAPHVHEQFHKRCVAIAKRLVEDEDEEDEDEDGDDEGL